MNLNSWPLYLGCVLSQTLVIYAGVEVIVSVIGFMAGNCVVTTAFLLDMKHDFGRLNEVLSQEHTPRQILIVTKKQNQIIVFHTDILELSAAVISILC